MFLALVLALFALFFDDMAAAAAAGGLVFLLAARAGIFLSALSSTMASLSVTRSVSSRFVRQGTVIDVTTRIHHRTSPSFSIEFADILPEGSALAGGTGAVLQAEGEGGVLRYALAPLSIGEHPFGGVQVTFSDLFFSTTIAGRQTGMTEPALTVLPSSEYDLTGLGGTGESETPVISPLGSPSIRSYRKYITGDDPRRIDWKLSAKFDELYVREFMGSSGISHLMVIDLPDASIPFPRDAFARMREAAVAAIMTPGPGSTEISVLLISGPNLISFLPVESDPRRAIFMMQKLTPFPRLHYLYRYSGASALRRRYAKLLLAGDIHQAYTETLSQVAGGFLAHRAPGGYEVQLTRVLAGLATSTVHVFTLAAGDASHLCLLAEQAIQRGMSVHLHIPREADDLPTRAKLGTCPFASVEVV